MAYFIVEHTYVTKCRAIVKAKNEEEARQIVINNTDLENTYRFIEGNGSDYETEDYTPKVLSVDECSEDQVDYYWSY